MICLIYASVTATALTRESLLDLLDFARAFNSKAGITGVLIYHDKRFVQVLEGPVEQVEMLMSRIEKDSRHRDVRRLYEDDLRVRRFPDWSMACLTVADGATRHLPGALSTWDLARLHQRLRHSEDGVNRFLADLAREVLAAQPALSR